MLFGSGDLRGARHWIINIPFPNIMFSFAILSETQIVGVLIVTPSVLNMCTSYLNYVWFVWHFGINMNIFHVLKNEAYKDHLHTDLIRFGGDGFLYCFFTHT